MGEITLDLRLEFTIPSTKLTINGLVLGLKQAAPEIQAAILTTLLKAIEEKAVEKQIEKDPQRYHKNGHQTKARRFSCSLCDFSYRFAQVKDRRTGKTLTPLVKVLSIPERVRFLEEALEPGIGLCAHVSYRRAAGEVERIGGRTMSHTTIHRRVQEFARTHAPFGVLKDRPFVWLVVDGTKVHLQGTKGKDIGQVEMRWALASEGEGKPFEPVGFWIDTSPGKAFVRIWPSGLITNDSRCFSPTAGRGLSKPCCTAVCVISAVCGMGNMIFRISYMQRGSRSPIRNRLLIN